MRRSISRASGLVVVVMGLSGPLAAADYSFRTTDGVMRLSGPITSTDADLFLQAVNRNRPRIIEVEGPGGDMLSAVRIGLIIRQRHLWTHAVGSCRSACAYIWMAGVNMLADEGVQIDNHLPTPLLEMHPNQRGIALLGWYLGKLDSSVDMMEAFLDETTRNGTIPNRYIDMLAFAQRWTTVKVMPIEIVPHVARAAE